jgi:multisubunit Na+/H+ antiporter MnhE subunit
MKVIHSIAFVFLYIWEVIRSTWSLVGFVTRPKLELTPRFLNIPLDLEGEFPRFLFACLVSMTPGTLSVAIDPQRGTMLVHFLDCTDPPQAIAEVKRTIERPLLRIFTPKSMKSS